MIANYFIKLKPLERFVTALFALGWGLLLTYEQQNPFFPSELILVPIVIVITLLLITATLGSSKFSALTGKGFVVIGVMSLVLGFVSAESVSVHLPEYVWLMMLLSGLWLERISPHQQFYTWMFLAIATKIEFVLVSGLLVQLQNNLVDNYIPIEFWWSLVVLMGIAVPLAAFNQQRWYRLLVALTTLVAFVLVVDIVLAGNMIPTAVSAVAIAVLAWPLIADRWVGRRIFSE